MARLEQIGAESAPQALNYCAKNPERCTYIAGWIHEGGLEGQTRTPKGWLMAEKNTSDLITGLVFISATGILIPVLRSETSHEQIIAIARMNPGMIRVLVGEHHQVLSLWRRLERRGLRARLKRKQLLYAAMTSTFQDVGGESLTIATEADLDHVVTASAAMAREEANDDPYGRNPRMFRERIRSRIERRRDFIARRGDTLVFKANVSAISPVGGHIEGIYTDPSWRRRGIGRNCTTTITAWVLERGERAALLVNDDNDSARSLYESLGYRQIYRSQTIFLA
jgi:ribosomal protein S18 acetylase RimI-like enzyme